MAIRFVGLFGLERDHVSMCLRANSTAKNIFIDLANGLIR